MRKTFIAFAIGALALTGCASQDYVRYAETQREIEVIRAQSRAAAEVARYQALAEIARTGDTAARVAAVISIQAGTGGSNVQPQQPQLAAPVSGAEYALRWAGVLLPSLTQGYGIYQNSRVAITQSNNSTQLGIRQSENATALGISTNNAFASMANANTATAAVGFGAATQIASQIKPNINISGNSGSSVNAGNTGTSASGSTAWQPLSGTGVIGTGSYADTRDQSNRPYTSTSTSTSTSTNTATSTSTSNSTTNNNPAPATAPAPTPEPTTPSCVPGVFVIGGSC